MKQYARTLDLADDADAIEAYERHHRAVWPEVTQGLREIGITQMVIWRLGRRLFMLMETVDTFEPERDFARYLKGDARRLEWEELMKTFQRPVPEAPDGSWWADMPEVFRLEPQPMRDVEGM